MRNTISRATIAGLAALSLMGSLIATSEPAAAQLHGGGRGGFHGGGFHGGGFHGGGFHGRLACALAAAGTGTAGAAAVGQVRLSSAAWRPARCWRRPMLTAVMDIGYGGCTSYPPIYDAYGNYLGQQLVNAC